MRILLKCNENYNPDILSNIMLKTSHKKKNKLYGSEHDLVEIPRLRRI